MKVEGFAQKSNDEIWKVLPRKQNRPELFVALFTIRGETLPNGIIEKIKFFNYYLEGEEYLFPEELLFELGGSNPELKKNIENVCNYLNASPYLIDSGLTQQEREEFRTLLEANEATKKVYEENKLRINNITVTLDSICELIKYVFGNTENVNTSISSFKYVASKSIRSIWKKEDGTKNLDGVVKDDDVPEDIDFGIWYNMTRDSEIISYNTEKKVEYIRNFIIKLCQAVLKLVELKMSPNFKEESEEYKNNYLYVFNELNLANLRKVEIKNPKTQT